MNITINIHPEAEPAFISAAFQWLELLSNPDIVGTDSDYAVHVEIYKAGRINELGWEVAFHSTDLETSMGYDADYWILNDKLFSDEAPDEFIMNLRPPKHPVSD